jgi:hypothetical protein
MLNDFVVLKCEVLLGTSKAYTVLQYGAIWSRIFSDLGNFPKEEFTKVD